MTILKSIRIASVAMALGLSCGTNQANVDDNLATGETAEIVLLDAVDGQGASETAQLQDLVLDAADTWNMAAGDDADASDVCLPNCVGKECGDDGCGGSCGDCPDDLCHDACIGGSCQPSVAFPEMCDGLDNNCNGLVDEGLGDSDKDGTPDCCEPNDDGVPAEEDNCPNSINPDQKDSDNDGLGDVCDLDDDDDGWPDPEDCAPKNSGVHPGAMETCDGVDEDCDGQVDEGYPDANMDCMADCVETDLDNDGIHDFVDNCPETANPGQEDAEGDGWGNSCDPDDDNDGVADVDDNCPLAANGNQADVDDDGVGNVCETDIDGDGFQVPEDCNDMDLTVNPGAEEICDWKDNDCDGQINEGFPNPSGLSGPFWNCTDVDKDADCVADAEDNCPDLLNPAQWDQDGDGLGDACDTDRDGDGVENVADCNPADIWVYPDAPEKCDGKDNDCDGKTDEGAAGLDCQDCDPCTIDLCSPEKGGCLTESVECLEGQACNEWGACTQE